MRHGNIVLFLIVDLQAWQMEHYDKGIFYKRILRQLGLCYHSIDR